jgi:hypothetical protein
MLNRICITYTDRDRLATAERARRSLVEKISASSCPLELFAAGPATRSARRNRSCKSALLAPRAKVAARFNFHRSSGSSFSLSRRCLARDNPKSARARTYEPKFLRPACATRRFLSGPAQLCLVVTSPKEKAIGIQPVATLSRWPYPCVVHLADHLARGSLASVLSRQRS